MSEIAYQRLRQQGLVESPYQSPADAVSWLGAVQAQEYPASLWSLGLRLRATNAQVVEAALHDHSMLRTWAMRGTLHYLSAYDAGWILRLVGPDIIKGSARRYRQLELDEHTLARSTAQITNALNDSEMLTRHELFSLLDRAGLATTGQRGVYMLQRASLEGRIAQGVQKGRDPTFYAFTPTLPQNPRFSRETALVELALRYFTSRGPATLDDFRWWSGLRAAEARAALDGAQKQLVQESVDGRSYYWLAHDSRPPAQPAPVAHLLPAYDEYLIGYKDRSASVEPAHASRVQMANGLGATVIVNGQVIGTWRRKVCKSAIVIDAAPFSPWSEADVTLISQATERYGAFFGRPAQLSVQAASD
ncbi:MAG TPA: winged helix DNA-binding domain-containing protein [Candidatus Limnocylindrales bacterium]|nr:winged helix DNA-binding domain-containing protein [Candidatus Limnocylindrales bacterium]